MASLVILGVGTGYVFITKAWVDHQARVQAQQSLRAAVGAISRELRISGACMGITYVDQNTPLATNFVMLSGTSGPPDSVQSRANPRCAGPVALTAACSACQTISVSNTLGFTTGMWAFIGKGPINTAGEYFKIQSFTATSITATAPLTLSYPYPPANPGDPPAFVAGADQRAFAVSSTCPECNVPSLTLAQLGDGGIGHALVKGIDSMTVRYVLNKLYVAANCNSQTGGTNSLCIVNLPETSPSVAGDWKLVRALIFTLGARSTIRVRAAGSGDGYYHLSETVEISPRNFIFSPNARITWTPY